MKFSDAARQWDDRYSRADGFLFGREPNGWLAQSSRWLKPRSRILCVGDGEGRNGTWLAAQGHRVVAFDISPVAIDRLRAFASERGVQVDARVSSLDDWTWEPDRFDAVVAVFIQFASPAARARLFQSVCSAVEPGGLLIIEGYGLRQLRYRTGGPGVAENLYTMGLINQAFQGWHVIASRDIDQELREGTAHVGRSHLISAVLKKPDDANDPR